MPRARPGHEANPFERIALAHIAQELLWDPHLIPLASFNARQRGSIMLMLRRMALEGSVEAGEKAAGRRGAQKRAEQKHGA